VTRLATPRLRASLWLTAVGILLSLAIGRPEPVAVAAPFALVAILGLADPRPRPLEAALRIERERVEEGEHVNGELEVRSAAASDRFEARLTFPPGLVLDQDDRAVALRAGHTRTYKLALQCEHWGAYEGGRLRVRRYDRLRLVADEQEFLLDAPLRVYPRAETLRALARPLETQASVGDQVARVKGDGIELAELRPFVVGDEPRRVNWRASARLGELVVNELHPERNTAVVLLLDTYADVGSLRAGPLDQSVRAAAALAARYLARRDRVGLMTLGGTLRWLRPGSGATQLHRIVETLLETRAVVARSTEKLPLAIPVRTIPPKALVMAVSPLLEDRVLNALVELRGRGFDVAVVEIPPLSYVTLDADAAELPARLLRLERELLRTRLRAHGIAVVERSEDESLEATIRAMEEFRRRARVVRV
jgi:uncharacterized protein (DUF58 family)